MLSACASNNASNTAPKNALVYQDPCASLKAQIRDKQKLDAEINTLAKHEKKYLKSGDTASAASAAHRLVGMRENQRLMKESLDQTGNACQSTTVEPLPVRGPAAKDPASMGQ